MAITGFYRVTRSNTNRNHPNQIKLHDPFDTISNSSLKKNDHKINIVINNEIDIFQDESIHSMVSPSPKLKFGDKKRKSKRKTSLTPGKAHETPLKRVEESASKFLEYDVSNVYSVIRKQTGQLGGNAAGGAIYGEITQQSFQKVINFLKENCNLNKYSIFLDIGSGLGKPNFHAAIDPCVNVSYGVELEDLRWQLSLHNLRSILNMKKYNNKNDRFNNRVIFTPGDITDAKTFDPFTHVYSFDVGFPPFVMDEIAIIFNKSTKSNFYASFHSPKKIIEKYKFHVKHIGRVTTSMSGSSETHTCYFYSRLNILNNKNLNTSLIEIDPLFQMGFGRLQRGNEYLKAWIDAFFGGYSSGATTRAKKRKIDYQQSIASIIDVQPLKFYSVTNQ